MSESYTVHNKTTKLAVLFALVGAMMIVIPMLTEQAYARTSGIARSLNLGRDPVFTNVRGHLDAGKWIEHPKVILQGHKIIWATTGTGVFGGNEKGSIDADFGPGRHVKFSWNNPNTGKNTCSLETTGLHVYSLPCLIDQGAHTEAKYLVSTSPIPVSCNPIYSSSRHCY